MSTRGYIFVKLPKNIIGNKITLKLSGCWHNEMHNDLKNKEISFTIPYDKKYMGIYVHCDADINSLGHELMNISFNNLIKTMYNGDRSNLCNENLNGSLYINRGESNCLPLFFNDVKDIVSFAKRLWCEYIYYKNRRNVFCLSIDENSEFHKLIKNDLINYDIILEDKGVNNF